MLLKSSAVVLKAAIVAQARMSIVKWEGRERGRGVNERRERRKREERREAESWRG